MDGVTFKTFSAGVETLSVGQIRELRRRLLGLDARIEVRARIDARGGALERCLYCGNKGLHRWGETRSGLQRLRCKALSADLLLGHGHGVGAGPPPREVPPGRRRHAGPGTQFVPVAGEAARAR